MNKSKVFIWDENLLKQCDRLPAVVGRASMVHELIASYGLLEHMKVVRSSAASYTELRRFHSEPYLDHLKSFIDVDEEYVSSALDEEYGIGYDCPPVPNMFDLVSAIAGGSITAAKSLVLGIADVAVNWCGGWHHAQKSVAEGFCYINDIVLAIEMLRQKFSKVLYIDLDVHHGDSHGRNKTSVCSNVDSLPSPRRIPVAFFTTKNGNGVQNAYESCMSVFTLSFHKYEPGFYPGTGGIDDIGTLEGMGYSCNVPLHASYSDETFEYVFDKIFHEIFSRFKAEAVLVQCGADALAHDPHGGARLTIDGYCNCVRMLLDKRKPTILLGGGGYKHPNAARLWTSITALVAGTTLDENIPEHSYWTSYGPDYMLPIEPTLARDTNKKSYLDYCIATIIDNLNQYLRNYKETNSNEEPELKRRKTESINSRTMVQDVMKSEEIRINTENNVISKYKNFKVKLSQEKNEASNVLQKQCRNDVYDFVDD